MQKRKRILIGHLTSNGDILYSSALSRQIKEKDYPDAHLTWAVSDRCKRTLSLNPYIDEFWEVPIEGNDITATWTTFCREALDREKKGEFDKVLLIQLIDDNLLHYRQTLRLSVLAGYEKKVDVPLEPVLRLAPEEVENVRAFAERNGIKQFRKTVLFECAPLSGQSMVSPEFALAVIGELNKTSQEYCFILSSNIEIKSTAGNIINASGLSFRENAELSKYCDLLVGCSSGITWLLTSDWARQLPMVQLLNKDATWFNSVVKDYEVRGKSAQHVLELFEFDVRSAAECIRNVLEEDFAKTRMQYHQQYNRYWCPTETSILFMQLKRFRLGAFMRFSLRTARHNNFLFLMVVWKNVLRRCFATLINQKQ